MFRRHLHNADDAKTFLKHFSDCLFYFRSTCADSITENSGNVGVIDNVKQGTTDDAEQSAIKQLQQQQHESASLSSGSTVLTADDYEAIPEDEWIASDMTMYDSPLADLERQRCYTGDAINTFIPVTTAASTSEPEPVSTQPEKPTASSPVNPSE